MSNGMKRLGEILTRGDGPYHRGDVIDAYLAGIAVSFQSMTDAVSLDPQITESVRRTMLKNLETARDAMSKLCRDLEARRTR